VLLPRKCNIDVPIGTACWSSMVMERVNLLWGEVKGWPHSIIYYWFTHGLGIATVSKLHVQKYRGKIRRCRSKLMTRKQHNFFNTNR
jgi:hypothetical protein